MKPQPKLFLIIFLSIIVLIGISQAATTTHTNSIVYLSMNGSSGGNTFTDSAPSPHTFTATGNAKTNTSVLKYGSASGYFDGTGDYISAPDSSDWYYGTGDFSIGTWVYFHHVSGQQTICGQKQDGDNQYFFGKTSAGELWLYNQLVGTLTISVKSSALSWNNDQWYYVLVTRSGNTFKIYRDGSEVASSTDSDTMNDWASTLHIGEFFSGFELWGNLDDFIMLKGTALSGSTVPSREYMTNPLSQFGQNQTSGPAPLFVGFNDMSLGDTISSHSWKFCNTTGNNTLLEFSTSQDTSLTFGPGNWTINKTVVNNYGTSISNSSWLNVSSDTLAPVATFQLKLIDTSAHYASAWTWNVTNLLGNNTEVTYSTEQNPVIYLTTGNWEIKLIATNAYGTNISASQYIGINLSSPRVYFWNRTA